MRRGGQIFTLGVSPRGAGIWSSSSTAGGDAHSAARGSLFIDERHHRFGRRSSSAWAKEADALRRISFA